MKNGNRIYWRLINSFQFQFCLILSFKCCILLIFSKILIGKKEYHFFWKINYLYNIDGQYRCINFTNVKFTIFRTFPFNMVLKKFYIHCYQCKFKYSYWKIMILRQASAFTRHLAILLWTIFKRKELSLLYNFFKW